MRLPQFSIKALLAATSLSLIATGAGVFSWLFVGGYGEMLPTSSGHVLLLAAAALIGAGILTPFKMPMLGAMIGALVELAILAYSYSK